MKLHLQQGPGSRMSPNVPTYCGTFAAPHEAVTGTDLDVVIAQAPENICTRCKEEYDLELTNYLIAAEGADE